MSEAEPDAQPDREQAGEVTVPRNQRGSRRPAPGGLPRTFADRVFMRRFEAYPSKTKLLLKAKLAGWAGIAFSGLGLIVIPRAFFRTSRPKSVMDDDGIHTGSSIGIIEWADIVAIDSQQAAYQIVEREWLHSRRFNR